LSPPPRPESRPRDGYISLLAISLTTGLAIFASAVAVGAAAYIRGAASEGRLIRTRIGMESAAATVLGRAAEGAAAPTSTELEINGRRYIVRLSPTSRKTDLSTDGADVLAASATAAGLALNIEDARAASDLADLSRRLGLNASAEDCLRGVFTYGRGGQPPGTGAVPSELVLQTGDQIDVRVSTPGAVQDVLWLRARLVDEGWKLHDYRRLQAVTACQPQPPSRSH
jgi:hypothetical protein